MDLYRLFGHLHDTAWSYIHGTTSGYISESETDQILQFFEVYEQNPQFYRSFLSDDEYHTLNTLRTKYCNCIAAIDHHNQQIGIAFDELRELRKNLIFSLETRSEPSAVKEIGIRIAQLKLELSDRKTKRNIKERERTDEHYKPLASAIAQLQLKLHTSKADITPANTAVSTGAETINATDPLGATNKHSSGGHSHPSATGLRQRSARPKYYSDSEIKLMLRGD